MSPAYGWGVGSGTGGVVSCDRSVKWVSLSFRNSGVKESERTKLVPAQFPPGGGLSETYKKKKKFLGSKDFWLLDSVFRLKLETGETAVDPEEKCAETKMGHCSGTVTLEALYLG